MRHIMNPSQFKIGSFGLVCSLVLLLCSGCGGGGSDDPVDTSTDPDSDGSAFKGEYYSGSGNCIDCHDGITDSDDNDLSIVTSWSTSMMANAARDPYWQAKVASELKRTPLQADFINDACSRCHAPMANDSANKDGGEEPKILDEGFLNPDNVYHDHAVDGVSCTLCHQITETGSTSGEYVVDIYADKVERPAFGEYADPYEGPMQMNVEFTPKEGAHLGNSDFCGRCHDLKTPVFDATGNETGDYFPEQMAFSEWENSEFQTLGQTCQDCHMPEVDGVVISLFPTGLPSRDGFSKHDMLGANTVMLDILDKNRDELGVTAQGFTQAIERNKAFLQTAAKIEILDTPTLDNGELSLDVKVTNLTGHKLPTAYPSRRMFIHLLVEDDDTGEVLFESGKLTSDDSGAVEGIDLDTDNTIYEPHYEEITSPDQVQVYEPIMMDSDGVVTHTLLRAAGYIKDNRLPPSGFDKWLLESSDVSVEGGAMDDDDFVGGSDTLTYIISVGTSTNLTVTAELKYQSLSYGHLQNLFEDNDLQEVERFKRMFDSASIRDETIDSASTPVN
ncbi:MAG: multiheme c-type cytochrome [Pseudomonadota bacterium]